jgi:hypothetical protein
LNRAQLFDKYAAYELRKSTGVNEYLAACRVFGLDEENREAVFFVLVGLRWIEQEIKEITEEIDG